MSFFELARDRYSERSFDSRPIEQEKLDRILEAGRIVPTACNYQPQRFFVLKSEQALATAKRVTPFTYKAPLMILVCYDMNTVWKNPNDRYYHNYNSGEQDASIAATTMMYEAEELGVHSIWIPEICLDNSFPHRNASYPKPRNPLSATSSRAYPADTSCRKAALALHRAENQVMILQTETVSPAYR